MYVAVDTNSSPTDVLANFRGPIVSARIAYPKVLHLELRDDHGETWRLATQDARWSPSDPAELQGRTITGASIDAVTGQLTCELSHGPALTVIPARKTAADDPPNWELITPRGFILEFGPGMRWQIARA